MIKKNDLILTGSICFFFGTSLKSGHYFIDIYLNIIAFPIYIFVLIYMIWLYKLQGKFDKKLLLSLLLFIGTSAYLSVYLFFVILILFIALFYLYFLKNSYSLEFVDIDVYSLPILISKNKGFFNLKTIVIVTIAYYFILFYLESYFHCLKVIPSFW